MSKETGPRVAIACAALLIFASPATQAAAPPPEQAPSEAPQAPARLVLICPEDSPQADLSRTLEALRSELADLPATVTAVCNEGGGLLADRIDHAAQTALDVGGLAAIWLDREDGKLVLNFVDPEERSVRSRTVEHTDNAESAALDALAVITRSTLDALIRERAGRRPTATLPAQAPDPVAVAPRKPPTSSPSARARLRLLLGYTGSRYAPGFLWQSGLSLAASYLWPNGVYTGVDYLVTSPISLERFPLTGDDYITAKIRRRPATLIGGYQRLWPTPARSIKVGLEAEFGASIDVIIARTPVYCQDDAGDPCPTSNELKGSDPVRFSLGFAPRLRFLFEPTPALLLYLGAGFDFFGDQTIYANCTNETCDNKTLFDPFNFRPLAQVGIIARI